MPWGHVVGRWYGNRNVRPILALHGWQDNLGTWDRLIPLLPQHIGVLCVDLPGHGQSSKYPKGALYHAVDYVHIIIRIIKEYNWRKVSLLGHSMGGIVCFVYATLFPHTIDLLMQIDVVTSPKSSSESTIKRLAYNAEKNLLESERMDQLHCPEPPSYSYDQLEDILFRGTGKSIDRENCKYLLNRSIAQSRQFPSKYYFSKDGRVKYYQLFGAELGLSFEMAKRIRNKNVLIVRSTKSGYIKDGIFDVIKIFRENNPNFELHEVDGTHHLHLNNAEEVAQALTSFILRHRPVDYDQTKTGRTFSKL